MSNASDFRIFGDILNKYMGDEKNVEIPDGLSTVECSILA